VKGEKARIDFAERLERHYAKERAADAEQPLVSSDSAEGRKGLSAVWYDRGGWGFWMLMQAMGREELFRGLHAFVEAYRGQLGPIDHPTFHDFFETLRPFAKDVGAFDDVVAQWFEAVTVPRLVIESLACEPLEGGRWRVRGQIRNAGSGRLSVAIALASG